MLNDGIEVIWAVSWSKCCAKTVRILERRKRLKCKGNLGCKLAMVVLNLGCKSLAVVSLSTLNFKVSAVRASEFFFIQIAILSQDIKEQTLIVIPTPQHHHVST